MNGSVLTVTWLPISLEDAGGFYNNLITLSTTENSQLISKKVSYIESNASFNGLDPFTTYSLVLSVMVIDTAMGGEIEGPSSDLVEVDRLSGMKLVFKVL